MKNELELSEVNVLLAMIEVSTFSGKDIPVMMEIIRKLQAKSIAMQGKNGKK
jgi:hypothetical protein